jgi:hypothetical protein
MTEERIKAIDRAKKLKEMADRGSYEGERDNAKRMLIAHQEKHGITDEEITGHKYSKDFVANYGNMSDSDFLNAILHKLANDKELQQSLFKLANVLADALFNPKRR